MLKLCKKQLSDIKTKFPKCNQRRIFFFRLKVIQKQRKHNQSLKNQLKTLNQNLNLMIEKINVKNQKKDQGPKQDTLKKSLQNQIKKSVAMKKELDVLRARLKIFQGQKITDLQDQICQKDKVIEQLNNTIKMYTKLEKQQSSLDIYKKFSQANQKINSLNEQIIHLKKKLMQSKKNQEVQQKSIKRQHQQLLNMEKKDKTSQSLTKKQQVRQQSSVNNESNKLKQKFEALQNAKKMSEKAFKVQIQNLKSKNKILQKQLEEYRSQLNRKDKQANILVSKMKQISRKSHPTLDPVEKLHHKQQEIPNGSGLFDHRKQFKGLMHLQNNSRKFDDSESLPLQKSYKIKSLSFVWFEEHILSLTTCYQLPDQSTKQIKTFSIQHQYKNTRESSLNFNQFQYIKEIEIFCSKFIQFIRIRTSRDHIIEVGNQKNYAKCKKFTYDIKTNQKPIAFMGAIQTKKIGGTQVNGSNKEHLISLGVQIKKKDVFTKNRFHASVHARSQSLMKKVQKLTPRAETRQQNSQKEQNDKNIVEQEVTQKEEQN